MKRKAVIISLKGTSLTKKKKVFKNEKPWGVILFERNKINKSNQKTYF